MSRCLGARVADLADGRLSPAEAERAFAHVAVCGRCRAALDAQRAASARLGDTPGIAPSDDLLQRLRSVPAAAPRDPAAVVPAQGGAGPRPAGAAGVRPGGSRPAVARRRRRGRVVLASAAGAAALAVVAVVGTTSTLSTTVVPHPSIAPVVDTLFDEHAAVTEQLPLSGPRIVTVDLTRPQASPSPTP
ncbi:MAG: hypothetical protein GC157_04335 [Frankiales bacterium]|nr:hypothetical protein [Frankiales bacterium]